VLRAGFVTTADVGTGRDAADRRLPAVFRAPGMAPTWLLIFIAPNAPVLVADP
jgi:hypothetical protein